jgi:RNA polymerase sigma-70 factor (ECF subfamily)
MTRLTDRQALPGTADSLTPAAQAGVSALVSRLFEEYRGHLLGLASSRLPRDLRGKLGPEDLVQDTFLKAHSALSELRGRAGAEVKAWLRTILINRLAHLTARYHTAKRRLSREVSLADKPGREPAVPRAEADPFRLAVRQERKEELARALDQLPGHYRQVIDWHHFEGLPFAEIGGRLGISQEAARKVWVRAREELRQLLAHLP